MEVSFCGGHAGYPLSDYPRDYHRGGATLRLPAANVNHTATNGTMAPPGRYRLPSRRHVHF
jgi:hypothetical protein